MKRDPHKPNDALHRTVVNDLVIVSIEGHRGHGMTETNISVILMHFSGLLALLVLKLCTYAGRA